MRMKICLTHLHLQVAPHSVPDPTDPLTSSGVTPGCGEHWVQGLKMQGWASSWSAHMCERACCQSWAIFMHEQKLFLNISVHILGDK